MSDTPVQIEQLAGEELTPTELQLLLESHNLTPPAGRTLATLNDLQGYSGLEMDRLARTLLRIRMLGLSGAPIENRITTEAPETPTQAVIDVSGPAATDLEDLPEPTPSVTLNLPSEPATIRHTLTHEHEPRSLSWAPVIALLILLAGLVSVWFFKNRPAKPAANPPVDQPTKADSGEPAKKTPPFRFPADFDPNKL